MARGWRTEPFPDWKPSRKWKGTAFAKRRMFFERHPEYCNGNVVCPACAYPTLPDRGRHDYCSLCHWEDDGHDDPYAHEINGGPNDSTLNRARENFEITCSVWAFEERDDFSEWNKARLFDPRVLELKRRWRAAYDELMSLAVNEDIVAQWREIDLLCGQSTDLDKLISKEVSDSMDLSDNSA